MRAAKSCRATKVPAPGRLRDALNRLEWPRPGAVQFLTCKMKVMIYARPPSDNRRALSRRKQEARLVRGCAGCARAARQCFYPDDGLSALQFAGPETHQCDRGADRGCAERR